MPSADNLPSGLECSQCFRFQYDSCSTKELSGLCSLVVCTPCCTVPHTMPLYLKVALISVVLFIWSATSCFAFSQHHTWCVIMNNICKWTVWKERCGMCGGIWPHFSYSVLWRLVLKWIASHWHFSAAPYTYVWESNHRKTWQLDKVRGCVGEQGLSSESKLVTWHLKNLF